MATSLVIPRINTTLQLTNPLNIVIDLNTIWLNAMSGPVAALQNAVAPGDATVTVVNSAAITVGTVLLIDNEPLLVSAVNGEVVSVVRAAAEFPFLGALPTPPLTTHAAGSNVFVLQFASPWLMLENLAIRPWVQQQIVNLGTASVSFGSTITGSLALA